MHPPFAASSQPTLGEFTSIWGLDGTANAVICKVRKSSAGTYTSCALVGSRERDFSLR
jgi:hypothetical protein